MNEENKINDIDSNEILAKVLFKQIIKSSDGNGKFDLQDNKNDTNENDKNDKNEYKIDKSDGMIIGLHTDWGGGKTTLIGNLEELIKQENKKELIKQENKEEEKNYPYFFMNINAWQFNKENKEELWQSVISYFYVQILENNIDILKDDAQFKLVINKIVKLSSFAKFANSIAGTVMPSMKIITEPIVKLVNLLTKQDILQKKALSSAKDNISLFYSINEDIKKILNEKIKNKYKKMILVIDDLDRCSPKEVVNLLDSLKLFLDIPNLIVIVAVDRRHLEKGIYEVYNKDSNGEYLVNPDEYIEKIIHLPVDLFQFDDDIKDICNGNTVMIGNKNNNISIENLRIDNDDEIKKILENNEIKEIYKFGLSNNPRKIIRFKRIFRFYYNVFININNFLNINQNEIDQFVLFMTIWLTLKTEWGDYFKEIKNNLSLIYLIEGIKNEEKRKKVIDKYSKVFYGKSNEENELTNYEITKLNHFIKCLSYFFDFIKNKKIIPYFITLQIGKNYISENNGKKIIIKGNTVLLKPLTDLELFEDNIDFKNGYIKAIYGIYEEDIDLTNLLSLTELNYFEKYIIEKFINNYDKGLKETLTINTNKKDETNNNQLSENNNNISKEQGKTNGIEKNETNNNQLSKVLVKNKRIDIMEFNLETILELDRSKNKQGYMITGLYNYNSAKQDDPKRFFLGSKIFFDYLIKNFDNITTDTFKNLKDFLGEKHVLLNLNTDERGIFAEIVNQISFAQSGPSIGGMTGATDYIQLNKLIKDANLENNETLKEHLKKALIVQNNGLQKQLEGYYNLIDYLTKQTGTDFEKQLKRLRKRLLYIFSHFWSLQDIAKFPPYYGASRRGIDVFSNSELEKWKIFKYNDLKNDLNLTNKHETKNKEFQDLVGNYYSFCISLNELKGIIIDDNIKIDFSKYENDSINNKFMEQFIGNDNIKEKLKTYITEYIKYKYIQDILYDIDNR